MYCNYSKNKFGNEVTFIIPCWLDIPNNSYYSYDDNIDEWQSSEDANPSNFLQSIAWSEKNYLTLLHNRWTPQQARSVLPNSLKTELVMTGTIEQWKEFFKLRSPLYGATGAHPQAAELADKLYIQFKEKNYI